jgi:glycosyltransferase involved in cell wall biosynthesis
VVIPTRDRGDVLGLTLASALRQRGVEMELIVVIDDRELHPPARTAARLADPKVRLVRMEGRHGVSAARNQGIAEARGQWIAFLDDDDLWAPDKLVRQLEAAERSARAWVYTGDVSVDAGLRILGGSPPPTPEQLMAQLPRYNPVPTGSSNVVVRADVLAKAGPFDTMLRRTEDWDMWIRLVRFGPPACVPHPLVAYRFHPANIPLETTSIVQEPEILANRYGIAVDRAAAQRRAAWVCLRAGRRGKALRHYGRAVSLGDVRSVGRAFLALVHPGIGSDQVFSLRRSQPKDESWRDEARAWLEELDRVNLQGLAS